MLYAYLIEPSASNLKPRFIKPFIGFKMHSQLSCADLPQVAG
jgi:hypothetical protein